MIDSSNSRVARTLEGHLNTIEKFQKKISQKSAKVTSKDLQEFHEAIKNANSELKALQKEIKSFSKEPGLRTNVLNAIRQVRDTLPLKKEMIETAAQQIPPKIVYELGLTEEILKEEAEKKYRTVGGVENSGLDSASR